MKKGQQIGVEIDKLAFGGKGIARVDNRVIFVEHGLPGDKVLVKVHKIRRNYSNARIEELLKASPYRQQPPCTHFGNCGGCKLQNFNYEKQLKSKREQIIESLTHLAGLQPDNVHDPIPSAVTYAYRNKMEFSFTDNRWLTPQELVNPEIKKGYALGLHVPGAYDRVMHIDHCWLQDEEMNNILRFSQEYFKSSQLSVFNLKIHRGLLRFLVIRKSFANKCYMVNVVTFHPAFEPLEKYAIELAHQFPKVVSIINTVNERTAQIAYGEQEILLHGKKSLVENLANYKFEISPNTFFQTNPMQAEKLFRIVQKYAGYGNKLIWDLYSGTGVIAVFLSRQASQIVGFELVSNAVEDANKNCQKNKINNCEFITGDIRDNIEKQQEIPDIIVCDPPRSGMHPGVLQAILKNGASKIIYVSCNPTTMARDLKILLDIYKLVEIQPVDMFPHTYHVESVAKLELL
jgi:23S rRNA (uracil1939-C5)-methyltransferase